ncbi:MAG: DUF697 domain-containing protein [Methylococcales bacterium]
MWKKLQEIIVNPQIKKDALNAQLLKVKEQLPTPVFWLLGKTQSGKTSIIRAITGDSRATIGDGMRPLTRTANLYSFPSQETCLIKFLDTRGLGEVDYDPTDDLNAFQKQAHMLLVVMKAMDPSQESVVKTVRKISKRSPHWPVIVVQTCLHEGYLPVQNRHLDPYPYDDVPWPDSIPPDLARSLTWQRNLFKGIDARFVAVDFTLPEDGYDPIFYGLESLWNTIEETLPQGIASVLRNAEETREDLHDLYSKTAHPHIIAYSLVAGAAGAIPLPVADIPVVTAIQAKLVQSIASLYDYPLTRKNLGKLGAAFGLSLAGNIGRRQVVKLIPWYGSAVSSLITAASTYALGKAMATYITYSRKGMATDPKVFREIYREEFAQGRKILAKYLDNLKSTKK